MKRCAWVVLIAALGAVMLGAATVAQDAPEIPGYVVSDLQLISHESLDHWSPRWTGPIQAATILAWFAEHGYPAFMRDFNGDGVIDEFDTIELADKFGLGAMRTESARGTTDVRLVIGMAEYIAENYPNEFVLKIYDDGFPGELAAEGEGPFDPDMIPGIELALMGEPTIPAYEFELESGEGVIVGLEEDQGRNTYLSGRSFLYETAGDGLTPLDFALSDEDRWEPGPQGQVLNTVGRMDERFLVEFRANWVPVEFMLALSPVIEHHGVGEPYGCPEDAVAFDVMTTATSYGEIVIEECVTREGDIDTYTWTVFNVSFLDNGCGLCLFAVPRPMGLPTVGHSETLPWLYSAFPSVWVWRMPSGSCGILPGEAAVFSVSVPGPTIDVPVTGAVMGCPQPPPPGGYPQKPAIAPVYTTGPGGPDDEPGCPDLTLGIRDEACFCDPVDGMCRMQIWANVLNIGTAPVTDPFDVVFMSPPHGVNQTLTYTPPPDFNPGDVWGFSMTLDFPMALPLCPTAYKLVVDPLPAPNGVIPECDESNNLILGEMDCHCPDDEQRGACCLPDGSCVVLLAADCDAQGGVFYPGLTCADVQCDQPGEECPDLVVSITSAECTYNKREYIINIEAEVTNIGAADVGAAILVEASCDCGSTTETIPGGLLSGASDTVNFTLTCTHNQPGCPKAITVVVDHLDLIDECEEGNNTATDSVCCD